MTADAASATDRPPSIRDGLAADLRGFGVIGIAAMLAIAFGNVLFVPGSAVLVLVWRWLSKTPWREIGYVRPWSWTLEAAIGAVFGVAFKFAMKAVAMPLLGAEPVNHTYHYLAHNQAEILPFAFYAVILGAGFGEETVFRGWLFERLGKIFGSTAGAKALIVLATSALFAAAHYSMQGVAGVEQSFIFGLALGTIMALTGRIWPLMWAHAAFDLTALAMIYYDCETAIAHLVFK